VILAAAVGLCVLYLITVLVVVTLADERVEAALVVRTNLFIPSRFLHYQYEI